MHTCVCIYIYIERERVGELESWRVGEREIHDGLCQDKLGMSKRFESISLGQGQGPKATKLIENAQGTGEAVRPIHSSLESRVERWGDFPLSGETLKHDSLGRSNSQASVICVCGLQASSGDSSNSWRCAATGVRLWDFHRRTTTIIVLKHELTSCKTTG